MEILNSFVFLFSLIVFALADVKYLVIKPENENITTDDHYTISFIHNRGALSRRINSTHYKYLDINETGDLSMQYYKSNTTLSFDINDNLLVNGTLKGFCAIPQDPKNGGFILKYHLLNPPEDCFPVRVVHNKEVSKNNKVCRYIWVFDRENNPQCGAINPNIIQQT